MTIDAGYATAAASTITQAKCDRQTNASGPSAAAGGLEPIPAPRRDQALSRSSGVSARRTRTDDPVRRMTGFSASSVVTGNPSDEIAQAPAPAAATMNTHGKNRNRPGARQ